MILLKNLVKTILWTKYFYVSLGIERIAGEDISLDLIFMLL